MEVVNNKYISTAITIGLGLYTALLGPNLPTFVKDLFKNTLFRILILFLVIVRGNKDPKMAIMIAVAFVLTLDYVYVKDAKEAFETIENFVPNKKVILKDNDKNCNSWAVAGYCGTNRWMLDNCAVSCNGEIQPTQSHKNAYEQQLQSQRDFKVNTCVTKKSSELKTKKDTSQTNHTNSLNKINNNKISKQKIIEETINNEVDRLNKLKIEKEKEREKQLLKEIEDLYQKIRQGKLSGDNIQANLLQLETNKSNQIEAMNTQIQNEINTLNNMKTQMDAGYMNEEKQINPTCVAEKVRTNSLAFGGSGGSNKELLCNDNSFVTEIFGRSGDRIDQLGVKCSDGKKMFAGGEGGKEFNNSSSNGFNKVDVKTSKYVNNIKVLNNSVGGSEGVNHTISCKQNEKIVGFNVRAGSIIDNIQVVCEN